MGLHVKKTITGTADHLYSPDVPAYDVRSCASAPPLQISLPLDSFIRNRPESTMNRMFIGSLVNNRHLDTRKHRMRKLPTRGDLSI